MIWRIIVGAGAGVAIGLLLHLVVSPPLDGACRILCHPDRAAIAGALLGAIAGALSAGRARDSGDANHRDEGR